MSNSFFWYDYETFGVDPIRDRIAQFAGIRTDYQLNVIADPVVKYCKLSDDYLPHPGACAVHGIAPQVCNLRGICEAKFAKYVYKELTTPNTCITGYNVLDFDEEFTRNLFYRNLLEPYLHQSDKIGNSRWDLIDLVRLMWAIRPDVLTWPKTVDGVVTTKLELLTRANGIPHDAHDALADVTATIQLAKLIKKFDENIFSFVLDNRTKDAAFKLMNVRGKNFQSAKPLLHISSTYSAKGNFASVVLPICIHPNKKNYVVVCNLTGDLKPLIELSSRQLHSKIFEREEGDESKRPGLHTINLTKCPVLLPLDLIKQKTLDRLGIDKKLCLENEKLLKNTQDMGYVASQTFKKVFEDPSDPDLLLYGGGFFSDYDRDKLEKITTLPPSELVNWKFDDPRLPEMLFRYRARNYQKTLSNIELEKWTAFRQARLLGKDGTDHLSFTEFSQQMIQVNGKLSPELQSALLTYRDELQKTLPQPLVAAI